jgi:hypothetical protein
MGWDREIEAATKAWADILAGPPVKDNGEAYQSAMGTLLSADSPVPTAAQLARFREALGAALRDELDRAGRAYLSCDYGPDRALWEAALAAGITDELRFPWKTRMRVEPGGVGLARGYGAPYVELLNAESVPS